MRAHHLGLAILIGAFALTACESNPLLGPAGDGHADELLVELTLSESHVHLLQPITLTVTVIDGHGEPVTDFETIQVERLAVGDDTWRGTELTRNGAVYEAEYTFASSGEYMLRVSGQRPGEHEMAVLHEMPEAIHAVRGHEIAGGMRIEFETFPGHLHEGDEATVKFWFLQPDRNEAGERPAIPGLDVTIVCNDAVGEVEEHAAVEESAGVYVAEHHFDAAGDFVARVEFPGADGSLATAEFTTHVAHGH